MSFDVITAFDVIEHLQDAVSGLRGLRSVLKSDGALVCTVPAFKFLWSIHDDINHHYRRYTREMLEREFQDAGFRVKYISYFNSVLFPPIAAARLIGRLLPAAKEAKSDLSVPPQSVNRILTSVV